MKRFEKSEDDRIDEYGTNDPQKRKREEGEEGEEYGIPEFFGRDTICLPALLNGHKTRRPISIDRNHIVSLYPSANPFAHDDGDFWYKIQTSTGNSFLVSSYYDWYDFVRKVHPDHNMDDDDDSYSSDRDTSSSGDSDSDEEPFDAEIA